ncbi:ComF family protein [Fodinicurvata fenggangensis]|uniref:ComF family protein n=1 Tax=Fodinicurvata fenggangensis TaxID=1121830 RepID=UPI001FDECDF0|nr:ComF family protein [Fodinicurvata fenggangensis]
MKVPNLPPAVPPGEEMDALLATGRRQLTALVDAVLPPLCPGCSMPVGKQGLVCGVCWSRLSFIAEPLCSACGLPFAYEVAEESLCGACLRQMPSCQRTRSAVQYNDASREMILRFKHADHLHAAPIFCEWMYRAGRSLLEDCDLVVPVPLHRWRLFHRRYNQAALLARPLAAKAPRGHLAVDLLERTRRTASQGQMTPSERQRNVRGAFTVRPSARHRVSGANLLLVDDVYTTGATLEACARTLLRAGAARVEALTLARVVKTGA